MVDVLGVANSNCGLFSLGALTGETTLSILEFASDRDVALFEFTIDADSDFLRADIVAPGLDTMLGLFDCDGEELYSYFDAVDGTRRRVRRQHRRRSRA